jgi:hypothetical protein
MSNDAGNHVAFERLLDYWFGDAAEADSAVIDEHLMQCDACGAQVESIAMLAHGTCVAFAAGEVGAVVGADFVARLVARDMHVREYRVGPGGSVHCTVAPEDDVLVSRLQASLRGVRRLDLVVETSGGDTQRLADVPFEPESGEVVFASRIAQVRALSAAHDIRLRLYAIGEEGSREVGHYTFHHRPWPG